MLFLPFFKVPLFDKLDDVILDNICDLVRPLIYSKGEKVRSYTIYAPILISHFIISNLYIVIYYCDSLDN